MPVTLTIDNYTYTFREKHMWFVSEVAARMSALQETCTWNKYKAPHESVYDVPQVVKITKTYVFGDD